MSNDFVNQIIAKKTHCFFVSPHLDDAIFSAGGLISELSGKVPMTVINVFTSSGDSKNTLSAKAFLKQCGYKSKEKLFTDRIDEDKAIFDTLGIKVINLGEVDALWRQKDGFISKILRNILPELSNIYPTYKFHICRGKISNNDQKLIERLSCRLVNLLPNDNYLIFSPFGIGKHVDHLVTRETCLSMVPREKLIFWADFPYLTSSDANKKFIKEQNLFDLKLTINTEDKISLCKKYYSQYKQVIKNDQTIKSKEQFYLYKTTGFRNSNLKVNIIDILKALAVYPKDFIFNLLNQKIGPIAYTPFSSNTYQVATEIIEKIKSKIPNARGHLIGSTGLKVSGQGDIDILIESESSNVNEYTKLITNIFGPSNKTKKDIVQWKIRFKEKNVDLDLINPNSNRFRTQIDIYNILNTNKILKNQYEILKYQAGTKNSFKYSVSKILFFDRIVKNSTYHFPLYVNGYHFDKPIFKNKNCGMFNVSIYVKGSKNKAVCKVPTNFFSKRRLELINEIEVLSIINGLKKTYKKNTIFIPKLISRHINKIKTCVFTDFISGKNINILNTTQKIEAYSDIIDFLQGLTSKLKNNKITTKTNTKLLFFGILYYLSSIIKLPKHVKNVSLGIANLISSYPTGEKLVFVHRDLNDNNIIINKNKIAVIDFQHATISNSFFDVAVILLYSWNNKGLSDEVLNELVIPKIESINDFKNFKFICLFVALCELSLQSAVPVEISLKFLDFANNVKIADLQV